MDGNKNLRYSIGEETDYNGTTANINEELKNSSSYEVTYIMTGDGSDAIFYFGQQGSSQTSGLKAIVITTPNASDVITYELSEVTINGEAISSEDLSTLTSTFALTDGTSYDGRPTVSYTIKTFTNGSETGSETTVGEIATDGENYTLTISMGGSNYVITFTNVIIETVLNATSQIIVPLTKANITSKDYLTVSTDNWNTGKSYGGYSGDFYNMSGTNRNLTIKVTGARTFEVYVQNTNSGRGYNVQVGSGSVQSVNHGATGLESSGIITIADPSEESTITISGTGNSVYPVYIVFNPIVTITPGYAKITYVTEKALDFSNVEGLKAYVATGASAAGVTTAEVGAVPAGTPLLLKGTANIEYSVPVVAEASAPATNLLCAGDGTTVFDGSTYDYLLAADGKFYQIGSGTIAVGKAYLHLDSNPAGARSLSVIFADDMTTGIETIANETKADNTVYNLGGQRVAKPMKGLYIVNGKKIIK